jgi:membrane fusion protein, multidrug efflux system
MNRRRIALVAGAVLVVGGGAGAWLGRARSGVALAAAAQRAQAERQVPVLVETAARREVPIILEGLGTVTPLATITVHTQVDGKLETVDFREGQPVRKGEQLAQVDPRPFRIAVAQASATLERDQAQLRNARLTLERDVGLRAQDLVPQQQVDDQQTVVDQAAATVGMDRAQLDNARLQLEWSRVVSPIDGVAGIRQLDPGNLVHQADPSGLVVLTQFDPISVIFTLPEDDLERITRAYAQGPRAVEAWSRDGQRRLASGELTVIDNQVNLNTATVRLRATFRNPGHTLWPNQFVKARLHVESKEAALVVSAAAVQRGQQGTFVYVVGADHTAQLRPVEVETLEGTQAILKSGVQVGEVVVIDGQAQLKPGSRVDARERPRPHALADAWGER